MSFVDERDALNNKGHSASLVWLPRICFRADSARIASQSFQIPLLPATQ